MDIGESQIREIVLKTALSSYPKKFEFSDSEFKKDFFRFFVIRKMVRRFLTFGIITEKLFLNNIIICLNIFGIEATNNILRVMCNDSEFSVIKSCLLFLNVFKMNDKTQPNHIITDILNDIKHRYSITSET